MSAAGRSLLLQLSKTLDSNVLEALKNRLAEEISQQAKPQAGSDFYSTKTSLITVNSPGLRRPVRSNNRKRNESPAEHKFSRTVGTTALEPNKQRAIYYRLEGDLPNLHSQDLLNTLYSRDDDPESEAVGPAVRGFFSRQFENINRSLSCPELSNLKELQLYYCNVESFRSLGTGWKIRSLTIVGSTISDFSGISGFALIEELYVPLNRIADLSQLSYHQTVKVLDLEGNCIAEPDQVQYLETLEGLEYVDLNGNPLAREAGVCSQIEARLGHKLYPFMPEAAPEDDDLWQAYSTVESVSELYPAISQLIADRTSPETDVLLSLQQERAEQPAPDILGKGFYVASGELELLHRFHHCKWSFSGQVLSYFNSKLSPENLVVGSRSRSKPKLAEISSKNRLECAAPKEESGPNHSEVLDAKQSFRDSIRSEARRKFQVRKSSVRKEGAPLDIAPLTESIRLRPGRLLLKSCLNKL